MSASVVIPKEPTGHETQLGFRAHDEVAWQAWLTRGRLAEARSNAAWVRAIQWTAVGSLLAVAGWWQQNMVFDIAVRFVVTGAALVMVADGLRKRKGAWAITFAALASLFNPVAPVFAFTGDWPRVLVAASVIPFLASLLWPGTKLARHD